MRIALRLHGSIWSSTDTPPSTCTRPPVLRLRVSLDPRPSARGSDRGNRRSNREKGESEGGLKVNLPRSSVCAFRLRRRMRLPSPLLFFLHLFYCPHLRNRDPALNLPRADRHMGDGVRLRDEVRGRGRGEGSLICDFIARNPLRTLAAEQLPGPCLSRVFDRR